MLAGKIHHQRVGVAESRQLGQSDFPLYIVSLRPGSPNTFKKLGDLSSAGDDPKWYGAEPRIEGESVVVSSKSVPAPKAARYRDALPN